MSTNLEVMSFPVAKSTQTMDFSYLKASILQSTMSTIKLVSSRIFCAV